MAGGGGGRRRPASTVAAVVGEVVEVVGTGSLFQVELESVVCCCG